VRSRRPVPRHARHNYYQEPDTFDWMSNHGGNWYRAIKPDWTGELLGFHREWRRRGDLTVTIEYPEGDWGLD